MKIKDLKRYVKILKVKGEEILNILPDVEPNTPEYRELVVNFNNTFSNIQQYEMLIKELEEEKANLED